MPRTAWASRRACTLLFSNPVNTLSSRPAHGWHCEHDCGGARGLVGWLGLEEDAALAAGAGSSACHAHADRLGERVHLARPENGQCVFDLLPTAVERQDASVADEHGDGWRITPHPLPPDTSEEGRLDSAKTRHAAACDAHPAGQARSHRDDGTAFLYLLHAGRPWRRFCTVRKARPQRAGLALLRDGRKPQARMSTAPENWPGIIDETAPRQLEGQRCCD